MSDYRERIRVARERLGVSIAGDELELKILRERVADLEVEASGLAADLSTARSATYVQRLAGEAERARREAERLRASIPTLPDIQLAVSAARCWAKHHDHDGRIDAACGRLIETLRPRLAALAAEGKDRREAYRQKPAWGAGPEDVEHE